MNAFTRICVAALVVCGSAMLAAADAKTHRLAIQVSEDQADKMNMVLNNVRNSIEYFEGKGEKVEIRVVAYGPGLVMFRDDLSPVKDRLTEYRKKYSTVSFVGCHNTLDGMSKRENKKIALVGEAIEVATGIGHLIELQEQGWTYIRP